MNRIRRFRLADAAATREVFVQAVRIGAAGRYSEAERLAWVPDTAMPPDWGTWLEGHVTLVEEQSGRITGFMMVERDGYLNMAFVRPEAMGKGTADRIYTALLDEVRGLGLPRLHVLASRYAQSFFRRHGWIPAPELAGLPGCEPRQGPQDDPENRPMKLDPVPLQ
jgi:putative acetyltransferase